MKDNKAALYAIALLLIGGLIASPSMQLGGFAFAQEENNEDEELDSDELSDSDKDETDETKDSDEYEDVDEYDDADENTEIDDYKDSDKRKDLGSYEEHKAIAEKYCIMTDDERKEFLANKKDMQEHKDKMDMYCQLDTAEREKYLRDQLKDYYDKYGDKAKLLKDKLDKYCNLSDTEKEEFLAMHDKMTDEKKKLHEEYCTMTDAQREEFRKQHHDMMMDFKEDHLMMIDDKRFGHDFVRDFDMRIAAMCDLNDDQMKKLMQKHEFLREHHERIVQYCNMSEEERENFRMTHHEMMEDYQEDFASMRDHMMDGQSDTRMKMQTMIRHYDISNENRERLVEKFMEKHSDLSAEKREEIKEKIHTKFQSYFETKMKMKHDAMSDLQRDQIMQRYAEMRDYKEELRQKYNDMSEEDRIKFQSEFRDKVSDERFSWISPQKQMLAGISVDEVECREGLNLVLKTSNGKALCVTSSTAERLIEKGLAVPAN